MILRIVNGKTNQESFHNLGNFISAEVRDNDSTTPSVLLSWGANHSELIVRENDAKVVLDYFDDHCICGEFYDEPSGDGTRADVVAIGQPA